jgi:hypothetical protein
MQPWHAALAGDFRATGGDMYHVHVANAVSDSPDRQAAATAAAAAAQPVTGELAEGSTSSASLGHPLSSDDELDEERGPTTQPPEPVEQPPAPPPPPTQEPLDEASSDEEWGEQWSRSGMEGKYMKLHGTVQEM